MPLERIAPVPQDGQLPPLGLASRWDELTPADLPPTSWSALDHPRRTVASIERALLEEAAFGEAARAVPTQLETRLHQDLGYRAARITVRRLGLEDDQVPTLDALGLTFNITRERVRQLSLPREEVLSLAPVSGGWMAVCLHAWIDLHPRDLLLETDLATLLARPRERRAAELVADALFPSVTHNFHRIWAGSQELLRAAEHLIGAHDMILGARGWDEAADVVRRELPGLDRVLDVDGILPRLSDGEIWDVGVDLSGRLTDGHQAHVRRVAKKIVTFLGTRACPISARDLADAIERGDPPFEVFDRPAVDPDWLLDCAEREPQLLSLLPDGDIWLGSSVEDREPTGRIAQLRDIVVSNGAPMRMQDLCDRAQEVGISRNLVGSQIHSRRAACLFMLRRGVVGLVGRDEDADPTQYTPVVAGAAAVARPGKGMGVDLDGALVADVIVRRSVHEQGFALPWPFSLAVLDPERTTLTVAGEHLPIETRSNGELRLDLFPPGTTLRLELHSRGGAHSLSIDMAPPDTIEPIVAEGAGIPYTGPKTTTEDMPVWLEQLLDQAADITFDRLEHVTAHLPSALSAKRRLAAVHALLALGALEQRAKRWRLVPGVALPRVLTDTLKDFRADPESYQGLDEHQRAAAVWMVRAGWLTPDIGWTYLREVCAGDVTTDEGDDADFMAPRPGASTELQIAEAIELALDVRRHHDSTLALDQAVGFIRRCLVALGHTGLGAIRVTRYEDHAAIEADELGCLILPVGRTIRDVDRDRAKRLPEPARFVTNGVRIERLAPGEAVTLEIRSPMEARQLDRLLRGQETRPDGQAA